MLVWSAVAGGAHGGWPLALSIALVAVGAAASFVGGVRRGTLTWRRTALDAPLAVCAAAVALQWLVGDRRLVAWALGPPLDTERFPSSPLLVGTVAPAQTLASLVLFLAYAAVYYLAVHALRRRRDLDRLVLVLIATGGVVGFAGLIDYLSGESWIFVWREGSLHGRLSASFVNPDHLATWLAMLVCLGGGYLMAVRSPRRAGWRDLLGDREAREETLARALPFLAIGVMTLAVVFTLSRGAIVALLAGLLVLVWLLRAGHRVRSSLLMVSAVAGAALAYSAWIGLAPLLAHVGTSSIGLAQRLTQYRASLPMIADFPLLGVGLGAYRAIYTRYQPLAHQPAAVYYPYAHSDLLQFVIETGVVGLGVLAWAAWRVGRDLIGAHGFGHGACPVGEARGAAARRSDPYNVPVAMGAVAGIVSVIVHAGVDFPLRIPANGFLAATLLGVATVALHSRFGLREATLLSGRRAIPVPRRLVPVAVSGAVVLSALLIGHAARAALVEGRLAAYRAAPTFARAEAIVTIDGADPRGRAARGLERLEESRRLGLRADGGAHSRVLVDAAIADFREALRGRPAEPTYHEQLASAHAARALSARDPADVAEALAHHRRAIASAPDDARLHLSLFRFALSQRPALLERALDAARETLVRDPDALERILDDVAPLPLADGEWLALVPSVAAARLRLAFGLETRALLRPATVAARAALAAPVTHGEAGVARWLLARLLLLQGNVDEALEEISLARLHDAGNPELAFTHAEALRARGDPRALDAYRAAVDAVPRAPRRGDGALDLFPVSDPRLRDTIRERVRASPLRYRKTLAWYLGVRGFREQALGEWRAVVEADGRDADARMGLAAALEAAGERDGALAEYRQAVALDGRPAFRIRLARRLWDSDQYFQAIAEWRAIRDREPRNVDARLALARALVKVGDRGAALQEYRAILEIDPGNAAVPGEVEAARRAPR